MAMSQCDDVLSIDEDFEDAEQILHPSLTIPIIMNDRKMKAITPDAAAFGAASQRGRGWRERDSILFVKAFKWIEEIRQDTIISDSVLMKDWELQSIQDNNMYTC